MQTIDCDLIEQHVRQVHLGRTAARSHDEDTDHEEEFYYTEFDIPEQEEEDEDEEDPEGSLVVEESRHEEEDEEDDEDETMTATAVEAGGSSVSATTPASQQLVSMTNPYCQAAPAAFSAGTVETLVPLLADHCDMARPPHENPEYAAATHQQGKLPFLVLFFCAFLAFCFQEFAVLDELHAKRGILAGTPCFSIEYTPQNLYL